MKIIINENTSLSFNMAAEEYLMKNFDDDIFMLWRASAFVLIGKNQNTLEEINYDYVKTHNIDVVRRLSGGGTVFCDLGNTNFAFIVSDNNAFSDFRRFTQPILEVLNNLGVNAEFSGRNDLTIEGKKFSGNAQYKHKSRLLHHGTLLFSSDIGDLSNAINPNQKKLQSKGISSVESRVTNISTHLKNPIDVMEFRQLINNHIKSTVANAEFYEFSKADLDAISFIQNQRFNQWSWNYGDSPKYSGRKSEKFQSALVELNFEVKKGVITGVKFYGDYFSKKDCEDIENALLGIPHKEDMILNTFDTFEIDDYFKGITSASLTTLFF